MRNLRFVDFDDYWQELLFLRTSTILSFELLFSWPTMSLSVSVLLIVSKKAKIEFLQIRRSPGEHPAAAAHHRRVSGPLLRHSRVRLDQPRPVLLLPRGRLRKGSQLAQLELAA